MGVSPEVIPFGLVSQSYETREGAKSSLTRTEKAARPIEEKESYRWVETLRDSTALIPNDVYFIMVCDREGDSYELHAEAKTLDIDFVICVTHDRRSDTNEKIATKIRQKKALGSVTVNIPRDSRNNIPARKATMEVASCPVNVMKPAGVNAREIPQTLAMNMIRITELNPPGGQEPIEWILATSLPIKTVLEAITVVEYYVQRWKIDRFHFVLKSGLGAEKIQQRSYERIKPVLFIYSVELSLDSTIVRAHQHSAGAKKGAKKTKLAEAEAD